MSINLQGSEGEPEQGSPNLKVALVGLGWDISSTTAARITILTPPSFCWTAAARMCTRLRLYFLQQPLLRRRDPLRRQPHRRGERRRRVRDH